MIKLDLEIGKLLRDLIERYRSEHNIPEPPELKNVYNKLDTFLESELKLIDIVISKNKIQVRLGHHVIERTINSDEQACQEFLNKYSFLENIQIIESNISKIDISNFKNLESLYVANNSNLENISGLSELKNLKFLDFFGNTSYGDVNSILNLAEKVIEENGRSAIDLLYYLEYKEMYERNKKNILLSKMKFAESTMNGTAIDSQTNYSVHDAERMLQNAMNKYKKYINDSDTDYVKYAIIHSLIIDNITYDHENSKIIESNEKIDVKSGFKGGTNSTYNSLIKQTVVCQGFTHVMQFLLKLYNIKAYDIACTAGTEEERKKGFINHSIQGIVLDGEILYSDVTFDVSNKYHKRDEIIKYFLMTEEEMQKDHINLTNIASIKKHPPIDSAYKEQLIKFAQDRIASVNLQKEIEDTIEAHFNVKLDLDNLEDIRKAKSYMSILASIKYYNFLDLKFSEVLKKHKQNERKQEELEKEDTEPKFYSKEELPDISPEMREYRRELEDRIDRDYDSYEYPERAEITEEIETRRIR